MKMQLVFVCTKHSHDRRGHWFDFEPYTSAEIPCPLVVWHGPTERQEPERFEPGKLYTFTVEVEEAPPEAANPLCEANP